MAEIDRAIESDDMVADGASAELARVRRRILAENDRIREKLSELIRSKEKSKHLQDAIITMRSGRYGGAGEAGVSELCEGNGSRRVRKRRDSVYRADGSGGGEQHAGSARGGGKAEIERVLAALSDMVRPYAESIVQDVAILSRLDVIFAKAVTPSPPGRRRR